MKKLKHSKIKNTGILYELLLRKISADVIAGDTKSKALQIMQEHFSSNGEIVKELELYQILINRKFSSESKANSLIEAVINARKRLNNVKIRKEKYDIIKKLAESYNVAEFFGSQIPNYSQYASVYKLFEAALSKEPYEPVDVVKSRHTLLEHISGKVIAKNNDSMIIKEFANLPEDVRLLTTRILVDRFNEKYAVLSSRQKFLLREYINDIGGSLKKHIESQIPTIKKELTELSKTVSDAVTKIKLNEVLKQIDTITKGREVKDESVSALLGYYELIDELMRVKNDKKKT